MTRIIILRIEYYHGEEGDEEMMGIEGHAERRDAVIR